MIQAINSTNNVNFNGRFATAAANHLKNNFGHYAVNVGTFAGGALTGSIKGIEDIVATKILIDGMEGLMAIVRNQRTPNGFANFNNPLTNTAFWVGKGTDKLLNKFFSKNIH